MRRVAAGITVRQIGCGGSDESGDVAIISNAPLGCLTENTSKAPELSTWGPHAAAERRERLSRVSAAGAKLPPDDGRAALPNHSPHGFGRCLRKSPILGDEYLYAQGYARSPDDGSIAWEGGGQNAAVAGDRMYFGGDYVAALGEQ
jgi:hypothetical protein